MTDHSPSLDTPCRSLAELEDELLLRYWSLTIAARADDAAYERNAAERGRIVDRLLAVQAELKERAR